MKHILKQILYIPLAVALGMGVMSCTGHSNVYESEEKEIAEKEKKAEENKKKAEESKQDTKKEEASYRFESCYCAPNRPTCHECIRSSSVVSDSEWNEPVAFSASLSKVNTNMSTITAGIDIVKMMLKYKLSIDDIMKLTGFSREEIKKIGIDVGIDIDTDYK